MGSCTDSIDHSRIHPSLLGEDRESGANRAYKNMAILLTKLEKGLSNVRALNVVISRRCKTLLN